MEWEKQRDQFARMLDHIRRVVESSETEREFNLSVHMVESLAQEAIRKWANEKLDSLGRKAG